MKWPENVPVSKYKTYQWTVSTLMIIKPYYFLILRSADSQTENILTGLFSQQNP